MSDDITKVNTEELKSYLSNYDGPPVRIMEVCGTHTHEIFRQGIRRILSPNIKLISGPGCPVCVTPAGYIDEACYLARQGCVITTFGDLVRVPGNESSLAQERAKGAAIKVVYSPLDAEDYAKANPDKQVVFLSVGFETTTPSSCIAVRNAMRDGIKNFALLTANKTMPGAYDAMRDSTDAYLYPGHVHAITGTALLEELAQEGMSGVVAGFTSDELLTALAVTVRKFNEGKPFFVNCYPRVVRAEGSPRARGIVSSMMEEEDAIWRGIGIIPNSGMKLKEEYSEYDARVKFDVPKPGADKVTGCRCGEVLRGMIEPSKCPLYGKVCKPDHPVGACMVSSEGACSAFYMYGGEV